MKTKIISFCLLLAATTAAVNAQTADKPEKSGKESITIRKKTDDKKMTIVIDGDKVTINGKPVEDLNRDDIEVLRRKIDKPALKRRFAPGNRMQQFSDGFGTGTRAMLGVSSEKAEKGAKVTAVTKESAAEKAGLQKGDIITKVDNDHVIESSQDLYEAIGTYQPGDKVTITYLRDGKPGTTTATLGKTDAPQVHTFRFNGDDFNRNFNFNMPEFRGGRDLDLFFNTKPRLGASIQDLENGKGVKITEIESTGAGAKAGLQKDDIITELDGKAVSSVDELRSGLRDLKEGETIKITYLRGGKTYNAEVKFPKKLKTAEL